jgi:iron-sulfur cluster assembly protein
MAITLTERAATHVQNFIAKRGKGLGLRLGVRTTGCSGMAYKLEYADGLNPDDITFDSHGVKVIVDPKSLPYIDGTQLESRVRLMELSRAAGPFLLCRHCFELQSRSLPAVRPAASLRSRHGLARRALPRTSARSAS